MPARIPRLAPWAISREDLAWAAGFVDGEGSFYTSHQGWRLGRQRPVRPVFEMGQTDPYVLEKFRWIVGFGNPVNGPYNNTKACASREASPIYTYTVTGFENVQALLALLWIWLGPIKREQAKSALQRSLKHGIEGQI